MNGLLNRQAYNKYEHKKKLSLDAHILHKTKQQGASDALVFH